MHVLDGDGGVVDENADRQRQPPEGHQVEGVAQGAEQDDREQHRQRDRDHDDDRGAQVAQEREHHQAGEAGGDHALDHHGMHGVDHEHRLVEQERQLHALRQLDRCDALAHLADDVERRGAAALQHREQARLAAVVTDQAGLFVVAVADIGHVADENLGAVRSADRHVADLVDLLRRVVDGEDVLAAADLGRARGQVHVLPQQRVVDVLHRDAARCHARRIGVDHHQPRPAPVGQRHRRSRYLDDVVAHQPQALVVQLLLGEGVAAEGDLEDRHARRVVLHDLRRRLPRRHAPKDRLRGGRDLGERLVDAYAGLEVEADEALAEDRVRFDPADVAHRGADLLLGEQRDLLLERLGRNPDVLPDDRDHRLGDLGKDVLRHGAPARCAHDLERAGEQHCERRDHESVWPR